MIGVAVFLGTPSAPWHVLQTSNLAPRMAAASAAFPGEATAGTSCTSAAFAGAASAARTTRTAKTVGKRLLVMFALPLFECPRSRDATALEPPETCRSQACGARWRGRTFRKFRSGRRLV